MDALSHTLFMWEKEAIVVMMILAGVLLFHYVTKFWSAPVDAMLGVILGVSIIAACVGVYLTRHLWGMHFSTRALWFIGLYVWCVLGMVFFAARHTRRIKLVLGLISQAGILFALFVWF
jgi:hypothetical protein